MNLQNIVIHGEEIVIDDSSTFNAIGRDVVLDTCTLRCRVPSANLSIRGKLLNSRVIVETDLKGFSWLDARLISCTLQGVFKDNEFGSLSGFNGSCETCVFTDSDLDDCTFYGGSCELHAFPKWPHFVVLHPHRHLAEMQSCLKHDQIADIVDSIEFLDDEANAVTYNSRSLSQRLGVGIENIRQYFSQFSFVKM